MNLLAILKAFLGALYTPLNNAAAAGEWGAAAVGEWGAAAAGD